MGLRFAFPTPKQGSGWSFFLYDADFSEVGSVRNTEKALDAGVDVIIAQGSETQSVAGGVLSATRDRATNHPPKTPHL